MTNESNYNIGIVLQLPEYSMSDFSVSGSKLRRKGAALSERREFKAHVSRKKFAKLEEHKKFAEKALVRSRMVRRNQQEKLAKTVFSAEPPAPQQESNADDMVLTIVDLTPPQEESDGDESDDSLVKQMKYDLEEDVWMSRHDELNVKSL